MSKEEITTTTVEQFVRNNLVPSKKGRRCVDGRYPKDSTSSGTLARPGGDFGHVMALLAVNQSQNLGLTPEECVESVFLAVLEDGSEFSMHTDHHVPFPNEKGTTVQIGCGHVAKAMDQTTNSGYGVNSENVQKALERIQEMIKTGKAVHLDSLDGEHAEKGVLVITGTKMTVDPSDRRSMYFVYDQIRDVENLRDIVAKINIPGLTTEKFTEATNKQLGATLKNLALGLPQFTVNADGVLSVQEAGIVG